MSSHIYNQQFLPTDLPSYTRVCRQECRELLWILNKLYDCHTEIGRGILKHFFGIYGIRISFDIDDPSIQKLKYKDTLLHFEDLWMRDARGSIWRFQNDEIESIAGHPVKFFNLHEFDGVYSGITPKELLWTGEPLQLFFKEDGSFINLHKRNGKLRAATLGSFGMQSMQSNAPSFEEKALNFVPDSLRDLIMKEDITLHTELITRHNHIVATYDMECLALLDVVDLEGNVVNGPLRDQVEEIFKTTEGLHIPPSCVINTPEELEAKMKLLNEFAPYCKTPEGLVVYKNGIPFAKVKDSDYLLATSDMVLNYGSERDFKTIDRKFIDGETDDYCREDIQKTYLSTLKKKFTLWASQLDSLTVKSFNDGKSRGEYAKALKKHSFPGWLQYALFKHQICDTNGMDYLFEVLKLEGMFKKAHLDGPLLSSEEMGVLSRQSNPTVQVKSHETRSSQMVVVFDLDSTIWEPPSAPKDKHGWWEDENSLNVVWYENVVNVVKGYHEIGAKVVFLTGRKRRLHQLIHKMLLEKLNIPFTLFTTPESIVPNVYAFTPSYKKYVCDIILHGYENVLVFDDDQKVQPSCPVVRLDQGTFVMDGSTLTSGHVIGICGVPGTGKTAILTHLRKLFDENEIDYQYVSTDLSGKNFENDMRVAKRSQCKFILLDGCFTGTSLFKFVERLKLSYSVFTTVPMCETQTKKGKSLSVDPYYLAWGISNVLKRQNHPTLGNDDFEKAQKVVLQKAQPISGIYNKCIQLYPKLSDELWSHCHEKKTPNINQLGQKKIVEMAGKASQLIEDVITPLNTAKMIYEYVTKAETKSSDQKVNLPYYRAYVFGDLNIDTPEGYTKPKNYHITLSYDGNVLNGNKLGEKKDVKVVYQYSNDALSAYRIVPEDELPDTAHVSLFWKDVNPKIASDILSTGDCKLDDVDKVLSGFQLLLLK
jgi:hypothetical protein